MTYPLKAYMPRYSAEPLERYDKNANITGTLTWNPKPHYLLSL